MVEEEHLQCRLSHDVRACRVKVGNGRPFVGCEISNFHTMPPIIAFNWLICATHYDQIINRQSNVVVTRQRIIASRDGKDSGHGEITLAEKHTIHSSADPRLSRLYDITKLNGVPIHHASSSVDRQPVSNPRPSGMRTYP